MVMETIPVQVRYRCTASNMKVRVQLKECMQYGEARMMEWMNEWMTGEMD
jgi:hypothetical protein